MRRISIALAMLLAVSSTAAAQVAPAAGDEASPPAMRPGILREPGILGRSLDRASKQFGLGRERTSPKEGFYLDSSKTIAGAGWIAGGPGYRRFIANHKAFVEGSAGISLRAYKMAQVRAEWPRVFGQPISAGSQLLWTDLTQVSYFGTGPDAQQADRTQYRVHYTDLVAYTTTEAGKYLMLSGSIGYLRQAHLTSSTGPFLRDLPYTPDRFPDEPAFARGNTPSFLHTAVSLTSDTRDYAGYPSRGFLYRGAWSRYIERGGGPFNFRRYELEGLQMVPLARERWTLAFRGWGVFNDTRDERLVPFYMLASLGGNNSLRSYDSYRFQDRNLVLASVETRVRLMTHVDGALFVDAGNVAARARDLDLAKRAYGGGVRLHTRKSTLARVDVAHGADGWQFGFNLADPFRLARLNRRTAPLPVTP